MLATSYRGMCNRFACLRRGDPTKAIKSQMKLLYSGVCLAALSGTEASFFTAVDDIFTRKHLARTGRKIDVEPWKQQNLKISDLNISLYEDDSSTLGDFELASGLFENSDERPIGEVFILRNKKDGRTINANFMFDNSDPDFMLNCDARARSSTPDVITLPPDPDLHNDQEGLLEAPGMRLSPQVPRGERDAEGNYVIDGVFVFSQLAERWVRDSMKLSVEEYSVMQTALLMTGFRNSGVNDVKFRVVHIAVRPVDYAVRANNTHISYQDNMDLMQRYGGDHFAFFSRGTQHGETDSGGRGAVNHVYTLQLVTSYKAWRHEIGHNAGMMHCPNRVASNNDYKHGWEIGRDPLRPQHNMGTIMCGNHITAFSNPSLTWYGMPTGHRQWADSVRRWGERKAGFSGSRRHVIPFADPNFDIIKQARVVNGPADFTITVPQGTRKLVVDATQQAVADIRDRFQMFLGTPTTTGFQHQSTENEFWAVFVIDNPQAGNWRARITRNAVDVRTEFHVPKSQGAVTTTTRPPTTTTATTTRATTTTRTTAGARVGPRAVFVTPDQHISVGRTLSLSARPNYAGFRYEWSYEPANVNLKLESVAGTNMAAVTLQSEPAEDTLITVKADITGREGQKLTRYLPLVFKRGPSNVLSAGNIPPRPTGASDLELVPSSHILRNGDAIRLGVETAPGGADLTRPLPYFYYSMVPPTAPIVLERTSMNHRSPDVIARLTQTPTTDTMVTIQARIIHFNGEFTAEAKLVALSR
eukprot:Gregarina_sp_Poly_1__3184@NODE_1903_length_3116_cov_32_061988_g81_i1_p1_GENE_NODE_1903_length_3116_cov_32_061988_g81_i1NODE_1903_length_3116_cov_32_061988_g81_i1_p1_ORF_typecomplete_len757_score75_04Peptidase_M66/PF10462_9/0_00034Peptidase_M54/PF07998_11/0_004CBM_6/PF03422_15/1_7CBM_6/PF03422_15/10Reprolysin_5/PF13688_6/0_0085Reprolysin_5/PF13688_6/8_9e03Reprolysin_4/PF13583_6/0_089Reprolysin_3/PF13582_6/0_19Reprolysin_3/PF13582_6/4_2e03Peptidase_M11/PF05548_11/0_19Peptidase_M11/PF05548_11/1_9e0